MPADKTRRLAQRILDAARQLLGTPELALVNSGRSWWIDNLQTHAQWAVVFKKGGDIRFVRVKDEVERYNRLIF